MTNAVTNDGAWVQQTRKLLIPLLMRFEVNWTTVVQEMFNINQRDRCTGYPIKRGNTLYIGIYSL